MTYLSALNSLPCHCNYISGRHTFVIDEFMYPVIAPVYRIVRQLNIALSVECDLGKIPAQQTMELIRPELLDVEGIYRFCQTGRKNPRVGCRADYRTARFKHPAALREKLPVFSDVFNRLERPHRIARI